MSDETTAQLERAHQTWELVVSEPSSARVEAALRRVLRVKRSEMAGLCASLPSVVRRGARRDLDPLATGLRAQGVDCELRRRPDSAG